MACPPPPCHSCLFFGAEPSFPVSFRVLFSEIRTTILIRIDHQSNLTLCSFHRRTWGQKAYLLSVMTFHLKPVLVVLAGFENGVFP